MAVVGISIQSDRFLGSLNSSASSSPCYSIL